MSPLKTAWKISIRPFPVYNWPHLFGPENPHWRWIFWHLDAVCKAISWAPATECGDSSNWPGDLVLGGTLGEAEAERAILGILEMAINPSTNPSSGWGTHVRFQGVFLLLTPCRLSLLLIDDGCRLWYFYIYKLDTECQSMTSSKYSKLFIGSDNPPGIVVTYPRWPLLCWVKSYSSKCSNVEYR